MEIRVPRRKKSRNSRDMRLENTASALPRSQTTRTVKGMEAHMPERTKRTFLLLDAFPDLAYTAAWRKGTGKRPMRETPYLRIAKSQVPVCQARSS